MFVSYCRIFAGFATWQTVSLFPQRLETAVSADTFAAPVHRRFLPVEFRLAVRAAEDTPDNSGGLLVNQPVILVVGVFLVAINGAVGSGFAGLTLGPDGGALLAAQVPQILFAHDINERRKLTGTGVGAVDAVSDGDEVDVRLEPPTTRLTAECSTSDGYTTGKCFAEC